MIRSLVLAAVVLSLAVLPIGCNGFGTADTRSAEVLTKEDVIILISEVVDNNNQEGGISLTDEELMRLIKAVVKETNLAGVPGPAGAQGPGVLSVLPALPVSGVRWVLPGVSTSIWGGLIPLRSNRFYG